MTNIKYETEIIRVLHAAGQEGLSVQKISLHVRNACSSLFEPLDMEEVHRYVQAWLVRNVKGCCPMVLRTARRGVYVINMESRKVTNALIMSLTRNFNLLSYSPKTCIYVVFDV